MRRLFLLAVAVGILVLLAAPCRAEGPSAHVQQVWMEYNVVRGGRKGMVIHARVTVAGCKGVKLREHVYFQYADGQGLRAKSPAFSTPSGYVTTWQNLTPLFPSTDFKDLGLFMPYTELNMEKGDYKLRLNLAFYIDTGNANMPLIGRSDPHEFTYKQR